MKRLFQKGEPHEFALHITTVHNFPSGYPYVKASIKRQNKFHGRALVSQILCPFLFSSPSFRFPIDIRSDS